MSGVPYRLASVREQESDAQIGRWLFGASGAFILCAALIFSLFLPLDHPDYVSTDSIHYSSLALDDCRSPLTPIREMLESGSLISVNWTSIVSLGSLACSAAGHDGFYAALFIINSLVLLLTLAVYHRIVSDVGFNAHQKMQFCVFFSLQTYLIVGVVSLNKEILSYLVVGLFLLCYLRRRPWVLALLAVLAGLIKIQFFAIGVLLIAALLRVRIRYILVSISLVLPLMYAYSGLSLLDAEEYFGRYGYGMRTEEVALALNALNERPFGYLVVFPARLLINVLAGLSPLRLMGVESVYGWMYQLNAVLFSGLGVVVLAAIGREPIRARLHVVRFMLVYALVTCILPFFQLRYFLPLFPLLLIAAVMSREQLAAAVAGGEIAGRFVRTGDAGMGRLAPLEGDADDSRRQL